jgi:N-acetylglucosamine kinase-like BadF-type ATPase
VAVVAGTSNNCWGWDRQRRVGRVTGNGTWFGEYGGAAELVTKAMHAVAAEWTRRGPATALTPAFIDLVSAKDTSDLLEGLSQRRYELTAEDAPLVFRVAYAGDPVAVEVVRWDGRELGSLANGVIRQLAFENLDFEVVQVGSLYDGGALLIDAMRETIHAIAPGAMLVRLTVPPVVGGVLLGMEQAGLNPSSVRQTLIQTTSRFLQA